MGSLMAGWDSPVKDPKFAKLLRNKSLTKEGIEEYWRLKKNTEDEHLKAISGSPNSSQENLPQESGAKACMRSSSLPKVSTKSGHLTVGQESEIDIVDLMKKNAWWTRSNWAFLNEPPVIASEVPRYKYAAQHHVANLGATKPDTRIAGV